MDTNEQIQKKILSQLLMDSRIDAKNIRVEFDGETAYLAGSVVSLAALNAVDNAVRSIEDVKKVKNAIKIRYPGDVPVPHDGTIAENVKSAIMLDRNIKSDLINVEVDSGIVTLSGSVNSYWSKLRCQDVISNIVGVNQIINNLAVVPSGEKSDNQVALQITESLQRMSVVRSEDITIEVEHGIVTISGKVPHWNAYYSVEYAARHTDGVIDVKNEMILA